MPGGSASEVRFEDVMVHFSMEEFRMLEKWQKELYLSMLIETYESMIIIGNPVTGPEIIAWFLRDELQNCTESQESGSSDPSVRKNENEFGSESDSKNLPSSSTTGGELVEISSKQYTKLLVPPKMVNSRSEEETAQYGNPKGPPELLCEPLMQRGSPVREESIPHLENAEYGSASPTLSWVAAMREKFTYCNEKSQFKGLHDIHQRVSLLKPSFSCSECGICFPSSWDLKRHQREHISACADRGGADCQGSQAEKLFFCATCGESCHRYLDFLQHQKIHEEVKVRRCAQCNTTFLYQSDLALHEEGHLEEVCMYDLCGANCVCAHAFQLYLASNFEKSMEISTDSQEDEMPQGDVRSELEKPYLCHQCGEQFRLEGNLQQHERYCHKQQLPKYRWTCFRCKKRFSSRYILIQHQQRHKAKQCQSATEIDKRASPASKYGGRRMVHVIKKLHKCQECGKRFVFKTQLVAHMKVHAKKSCHQRPFCKENLGYKGSFQKQPCIHLGEGPSNGRRQEDLGTPAVAAEQYRMLCATCGKRLSKNYFPDHEAWHRGVRYRCCLCGNISNFRSASYRHLWQHRQRGDYSICPKCGNTNQSKSCHCLMQIIYLGQNPLPPLYDQEGVHQPTKA